jgi:phosphoribosylformimino-5-aminoimidazole carboxamide ribotide isomerase
LTLAQSYAAAGAHWLHAVDLDGARSGALENLRVIEAIASTSLQVQAGGGVRSEGDLQRLFDAGVARVVVGSVAVRDPECVENWITRYGNARICIALDTRADAAGWWTLPVKGWTEVAQSGLDELARRYARAGARHLLCTDIERDGMMSGPNFALYAHLRDIAPELAVQASGGVRGIDDLRLLRDGGASAAILGRSLLEGRLALADALQC